jgi:DNA-binding CsgD family transcriptional regulator
MYQASLQMAETIGYQLCIAINLSALSLLAADQGQPVLAKERAEASLAIWNARLGRQSHTGILITLSIIAAKAEDYDTAAGYCYEALTTARQTNTQQYYVDAPHRECLVAVANLFSQTSRQLRAAELLGLAFLDPWPWGGQERKPVYMRLQKSLQAELGEAVYHTAWAHGQTLDLDTTFNALLQEFTPRDTTEDTLVQELAQPLTQRELEVLSLLTAGLSNREIATKLYISMGTVKVHIRNIYRKLAVSDRSEATTMAQRLNLI